MNIAATITGIIYETKLTACLKNVAIDKLDINTAPSCFLLSGRNYCYAVSKWVSPKRTRSYPYERVYNTLSEAKKITVIPIIKDEGLNGDRDFIQWDTVALMSLLDVYVIPAYYKEAEAHPTTADKITNQRFDNDYVIEKINEVRNYHSSALHWNLKEIDNMPLLIEKVIKSYDSIGNELCVSFHNIKGLKVFQQQFQKKVSDFMDVSRLKAMAAQNREHLTTQPKEHLGTSTKAKITIKNYLGGHYYFTVDEMFIEENTLYIIECKHSANSKLPSIGDIKDGLLKMVLYSNLSTINIGEHSFSTVPILKLTSNSISGRLTNSDTIEHINDFHLSNGLNEKQQTMIANLLEEAKLNGFEVEIEGA